MSTGVVDLVEKNNLLSTAQTPDTFRTLIKYDKLGKIIYGEIIYLLVWMYIALQLQYNIKNTYISKLLDE